MEEITNTSRFYIVKRTKNSIVPSIYPTIRFLQLNLIYSNLGIARISEYSSVFQFGRSLQMRTISAVYLDLERGRKTIARLPDMPLLRRNAFYAIHDFRRVHKFENSFAWQISILLRFRSIIPAMRGERMAPHQLFPLLHVLPCHGVLTRKPIYPDDNIDAGSRPVRPGAMDMIPDNTRIAVLSSVRFNASLWIPSPRERWSLRYDIGFSIPLFVL